jgi:hypothetical protein
MMPVRHRLSAALLMSLAACAPSLNWRDTRPEESGVRMLFPCRPDRHERTIRIADAEMRMRMHSCSAAGAVFSLAFVDVAEPARVTPVLVAMRGAAAANLNGTAAARPWVVPGATPNEKSALVRVEGRLPDGRLVVEHATFFVKGLRLYQATALGDSLDADAIETFFGSITVVP